MNSHYSAPCQAKELRRPLYPSNSPDTSQQKKFDYISPTTSLSSCISFEQKKKTLAAFLDISGAYDIVLIDVLFGTLCDLQLPLEMVCILWDLLHRRSLIFYHGGEAYTRRVGVKGLPQGSVISSLLYNVGGSGIDAQMVRGVSLLQYADDLVIYASGFIVQ
jgi:hypothetical protein